MKIKRKASSERWEIGGETDTHYLVKILHDTLTPLPKSEWEVDMQQKESA